MLPGTIKNKAVRLTTKNTNTVQNNNNNNNNGGTVGGENGRSTSTRSRTRKLSVKQRLPIYKYPELKDEIDILDKQQGLFEHEQLPLQQRDIISIETGVEKHEEKEEHLKNILLNQNQLTHNYIPTPDASKKWNEYKKYYQGNFEYPTEYIKGSNTVEDYCRPPYLMDEEDAEFLKELGLKNVCEMMLSEDQFEFLCSKFEEIIHERQPFLAVEPESILSFEEVKPLLVGKLTSPNLKNELANELNVDEKKTHIRLLWDSDIVMRLESDDQLSILDNFGKQVYDHWKARKLKSKGESIFPELKFEKHSDHDDHDPYVCFRRRALRHSRKTRKMDIQNSQKLRILLKQLERTKEMALYVSKRENINNNLLLNDYKIFLQRSEFKTLKRKLNSTADDQLLIDVKRRKKPPTTFAERKNVYISAEEAKRADLKRKLCVSENYDSQTINNSGVKPISSSQAVKISGTTSKRSQKGPRRRKRSTSNVDAALDSASSPQVQQPINQQQKQQQQQDTKDNLSHIYIKLSNSKIPDIELEDADKVLGYKEISTQRYVEDKMKKRHLEDGNCMFNLTDDPHNPVFDIELPDHLVDPSTVLNSSISANKYKFTKAYYCGDLDSYLDGVKKIQAFDANGTRVDPSVNGSSLEVYDVFDDSPVYSQELPIQMRRRAGRYGVDYLDKRQDKRTDLLNEFFDFDELVNQELEQQSIDVYSSNLDSYIRLQDKWKHDYEHNLYGNNVNEEPALLNRIPEETQVIRFGTMLWSKAYDQSRDALAKYRKEQYLRVKKQQQLQQQQQKLLEEQLILQQKQQYNESSQDQQLQSHQQQQQKQQQKTKQPRQRKNNKNNNSNNNVPKKSKKAKNDATSSSLRSNKPNTKLNKKQGSNINVSGTESSTPPSNNGGKKRSTSHLSATANATAANAATTTTAANAATAKAANATATASTTTPVN
ncbi:related to Enhancer of polycomb-like protein 1 [Saccharomycodes ludwigii]|uniref:Enhancer of polycomb-like protein n=1 Tax=Saccharomycodes ludwigii TaxID=36035 RepID=A0A376B315_9ASCO|nr:related to Enhancer of polycomb-like protein 1 [Saccharomycodes ludwigii]